MKPVLMFAVLVVFGQKMVMHSEPAPHDTTNATEPRNLARFARQLESMIIMNMEKRERCERGEDARAWYDEDDSEIAYDEATPVTDELFCASETCSISVAQSTSRTDTFTYSYKVGWSIGDGIFGGKILDALNVKCFSGDISWSFSKATTTGKTMTYTCPSSRHTKIWLEFSPKYKRSTGTMHVRRSSECKGYDFKDEDFRTSTISYAKLDGHLSGRYKCRSEPTGSSSGSGSTGSSVRYGTADGCKPDWYNECTSGYDCCSWNYDTNQGQWAKGVCRPAGSSGSPSARSS